MSRLVAPLLWLSTRKLECCVVLVGIVLRLSMITNYRFDWNYDSNQHWEVIEWILQHRTIPGAESTFSSFHPPLFYVVAAWLVDSGWTRPELVYLSVGCGIARLLLIWVGLEIWMPRLRLARIMGLALASVLCASVHIDGMIYAEPVSSLLHVVLFIVAPFALKKDAQYRLPLALLLGLLFGLAMLTKISVLVTLGAFLVAAGLKILFTERGVLRRISAALPHAAMLSVILLMTSWYYVQNLHQYGRVTVTSFNLPSQAWLMKEAEKSSVLDRRSLGYVFGWSSEIYLSPHRPSALSPTPRFFPVAIASAVVDYWGFGYAGYANDRRHAPMRDASVELRSEARAAMLGGTVIFVAMVVGWICCSVVVARRRDAGRAFLLLAPFLTLVAALQFAIVHPIDDYGVVKAAYMMFTAPVLFAVFGVAFEWAWRRRSRWPIVLVLVGSLLPVGWYSVKARLTTHYPWDQTATLNEGYPVQQLPKGLG